jgi:hypothetical protein
MGGEYVEGNVISVEVTSCDGQTANHVMWHYANWRLHGKKEDEVAWRTLAGYLDKEEATIQILQETGRKSGALARATGQIHTIRTQESTRKGGKIQGCANRDSGHIQRIGREQGKKNVESGHFQRITTKESCAKGGSISGVQKWIDPDHPELGTHNAGNLVKLQKKYGYPCQKENRKQVG